MHRWFFATEREECEPRGKEDDEVFISEAEEAKVEPVPVRTTEWPFCVIYHRKLAENEYLGISGNCHKLGDWDPKNVYVLEKGPCHNCMCKCHQYEAVVEIPRNIDIEYRYCVVAYDPQIDEVYIRYWEAQLKPRVIRTCDNMLKICDCFGHPHEDEGDRTDRGWATTESIVQLSIFNAPFLWQGQRQRMLYIRIQPMYRVPEYDCSESKPKKISATGTRLSAYVALSEIIDDRELQLAYVEVVNLIEGKKLAFQPKFGVRCGKEDLQLFHCSVAEPETTLYRLDLYTYAHKACMKDEPPYHYGFGFVNPEQLEGSEGCARVKITCASTHRPLIEMNVRYLIIRPLENFKCDLSHTYERYWRSSRMSLNIGHRGSGNTYRIGNDVVRENTLYGFKQAAMADADMVEFDVHLTQDAQVVVYHDFMLRFMLQRTPSYEDILENHDLFVFPFEKLNKLMLLSMGGSKNCDHIAVPLEAFTYDQLRLVKVLRYVSGKGCNTTCDEMINEQRPFPLLLELFDSEDVLPISMGFNIEIKWPQLDDSRRWESGSCKSTFDRNFYVDTILEIVLNKAGKRRIVFSSFDADICAMVRYKQNLYPVCLITADPSSPVQYADMRVRDFDVATGFANAMELFGLSLNVDTVLAHSATVAYLRQFHLIAMVWGEANTRLEVRKKLRQHGVMGIIYDRLDQLDQVGDEMEGTVCTIDSMATRRWIEETEVNEWRDKCGYRSVQANNPFI
ncbi:hypothetical protein KR018_002518 [Drosophila ironensis]|nr:hypothetical protein KR018_002518 [Drosophila ironensis]